MNKKEALRIIIDSAKLYEINLENKNILFLSAKKNKYSFIESRFLGANFLHLTGADTKLRAKWFYKRCLQNKLSDKDFNFKSNGTTVLKLQILPQLMNIYNCKMIGNYNNGSKLNLYTEKLAGNVKGCLGFIKEESYYVPVTALKEDTRDLILNQEQVIAIFSKSIYSQTYTTLEYLAKGVNIRIDTLPKELLKKVDVNELTRLSTASIVKKIVSETEDQAG